MSLDADAFVERRRMKRGLLFWRLATLAAAVAAVAIGVARFGAGPFTDHVARIEIDGLILQDPKRDQMLADIAADRHAKALVVTIDSPGGTFIGGETLYKGLRRVAEKKPVVAVMDGIATSGGYMAAIGADYIFAGQGTMTGSIGVIFQTADITGLLDKIGVKPETYKSGPLKAQPNPLEKTSPTAREATQGIVREMFGLFVDMVAERRQIAREKVLAVADGRVVLGQNAKDLGLVDAIGGETEARAWLAENRGVGESLPSRKVSVKRERELLSDLLGDTLGKALFSERLRLDGALAVWHPSLWQ